MPEPFADVSVLVLVGFVAWLAIRLSRFLRARDVDYTRAMQADMDRREGSGPRARPQGRRRPEDS